MSVQAGIELDLDLATLVGEFEEQACESEFHDKRDAHSGPGTHYVEIHHECARDRPRIQVRCAKFVEWLGRPDVGIYCSYCGHQSAASEFMTILGPIESFR